MGILTLEDFNTLLGLYGGITTEYVIDSTLFDGEGYYNFLDVSVSGSDYVVEVVNSLFTGTYTVLSGASVSYSDGTFTFPTAQTTRIKILMGMTNDSKLEFTKFVARPVHQDYVCSMVAKDTSGTILANKSVSIGGYTGTTNSDGEVSITIPSGRADLYQYPVSVDNVEMDTLELLRTKVSLNPVCTTSFLYISSKSTLSFNLGNIGHSVECKCTVNGYTYTASSNSSTGVVSFTVNLSGYDEDSVNYSLKVISDDWVNETNITGEVPCAYYIATSYSQLKAAYNAGIDTVKIEGTITIDTVMYINKDFTIVGGEDNLLTGGTYWIMNTSNKTLKLEGVNADGLTCLIDVGNNHLILESCSFSSSGNLATVVRGTVSSINSRYENMRSQIFSLRGGTLNIDSSEFIITDLTQTDVRRPCVAYAYGSSIEQPYVTMNVNHSMFNIEIEDTISNLGIIPSLFELNRNTIFNNVPSANLRANNALPMDTNTGDVDFKTSTKHYTSAVSGKAFMWSSIGGLYYENVTTEEL